MVIWIRVSRKWKEGWKDGWKAAAAERRDERSEKLWKGEQIGTPLSSPKRFKDHEKLSGGGFNPLMHGRFYRPKTKVLWKVVKLRKIGLSGENIRLVTWYNLFGSWHDTKVMIQSINIWLILTFITIGRSFRLKSDQDNFFLIHPDPQFSL